MAKKTPTKPRKVVGTLKTWNSNGWWLRLSANTVVAHGDDDLGFGDKPFVLMLSQGRTPRINAHVDGGAVSVKCHPARRNQHIVLTQEEVAALVSFLESHPLIVPIDGGGFAILDDNEEQPVSVVTHQAVSKAQNAKKPVRPRIIRRQVPETVSRLLRARKPVMAQFVWSKSDWRDYRQWRRTQKGKKTAKGGR